MGRLRMLLVHFIPDRRLRPVLAGFCIGLIGLVIPYAMSIGYGTVGNMLLEKVDPVLLGVGFPLGVFLAIVLFGKLLATALSFAAGFPGGLLGPALFLGAVVGALFGDIVHSIAPSFTESYGAYALVACGALTAAALQAPITIMLMVFELSADYRIMLPLMAACIVATLVKRSFGHQSVFTEALEERGIEMGGGLEKSWMRSVKVSRIQWRPIPSIPEHTPLVDLKRIYVDSGKGCVQVVDDKDEMLGLITFTDLQPWLLDATMDHVAIASEICNRKVLSISEDDSLLDAIATFDREVFEQLPVTATDNPKRVLGILSRHSVFSTYHQLIVKHGEHGEA
jgi:CIC family chloride channel protein